MLHQSDLTFCRKHKFPDDYLVDEVHCGQCRGQFLKMQIVQIVLLAILNSADGVATPVLASDLARWGVPQHGLALLCVVYIDC